MRIKLEYGKNGLWIDVPDRNLLAVLDRDDRPAPADQAGLVERALREPIGSPEPCRAAPAGRLRRATGTSLHEAARGSRRACVVICDITRPVRNHLLLPPIIRELERAGVGEIRILIGNGLHREMTPGEIERSVGTEIAASYPVHNHLARDPQANVRVGTTSRGTPVHLDRIFVESDFRVITGLVEPHMYAGFSGGRKLIAIGVAGVETIRVIHSPLFLEDASVRAGNLTDNILHREACEIARMAPAQFAVNVTINRQREFTEAWAGDVFASHEAAADAALAECIRYAPGRPDIVITTNAGYPADLNLYQAGKGMQAGADIVKPGGTVIFAAEFCEGLGGSEFAQLMMQAESPEWIMRRLTQPGFFMIDQWGAESLIKAMRTAEIMVYTTGLPPETIGKCFLSPIASVEEGIRTALQKHGPGATIAVIPKGPYVIGAIKGDNEHGQESLP